MTALAAPRTYSPGWWRTAWAVALGVVLAGIVSTILQTTLASTVGWPDPTSMTAVPGLGWPWRIDGPWSLAADLGPALLFGAIFAWGAQMVLGAREGITALRPSIALTAAALVLLTRGMSEFVAFNLPVMVALVIVVRLRAGCPRRSAQWTWKRIAAALLAYGALGATTVSYGRLNALSADDAEITKAHVTIPVRGIGNDIVNLTSVRVPDAPAGVTVGVWNPSRTSVSLVDGASILPGEVVRIALGVPPRCSPGTVDRLDVRMKVGDRELHQTVRLDKPVELCA
jgi:hypothetical protein